MIEAASWRWVFLVNVPLAGLVIVLAAVHVPESRDLEASGQLDWWGAIGSVLALGRAHLRGHRGRYRWPVHSPSYSPRVWLCRLDPGSGLDRTSSAASLAALELLRVPRFANVTAVTFFAYDAIAAYFLLGPPPSRSSRATPRWPRACQPSRPCC